MLDTNIVSHLVRGHPDVVRRMVATPMPDLCISAITEGELCFGRAKRPQARPLHLAVDELLRRVVVLPWDRLAAQDYGVLRAEMSARGLTLAPLDLMIAAHARAQHAILVSSDRAFAQTSDLLLEDWTQSAD